MHYSSEQILFTAWLCVNLKKLYLKSINRIVRRYRRERMSLLLALPLSLSIRLYHSHNLSLSLSFSLSLFLSFFLFLYRSLSFSLFPLSFNPSFCQPSSLSTPPHLSTPLEPPSSTPHSPSSSTFPIPHLTPPSPDPTPLTLPLPSSQQLHLTSPHLTSSTTRSLSRSVGSKSPMY